MSGFVLKPSARRRTNGRRLPEHSDQQRETLLSNDVKQCSDLSENVEEIGKLWGEAQETSIIGRYLLQAKLTLPYGQLRRMVATQLPFGENIANQLRCIAPLQSIRNGWAWPRCHGADSKCLPISLVSHLLLEACARGKVVRQVTRRETDELQTISAEKLNLANEVVRNVSNAKSTLIRKRIVIRGRSDRGAKNG